MGVYGDDGNLISGQHAPGIGRIPNTSSRFGGGSLGNGGGSDDDSSAMAAAHQQAALANLRIGGQRVQPRARLTRPRHT
jgi:hypothetical protein